MAILVTGGAGYIGSHTAVDLLSRGQEIVVLDNLHSGHREALSDSPFYQGDVHNTELLDQIFRDHRIDAVIHFAANALVAASMEDPLTYYDVNVVGAHRLLTKMQQHGVRSMVFSSTAAVYGEPSRVPIEETEATRPTNPYGETKLAVERMLAWCDAAYGIKSICLRYFNAAGAHPQGHIGEDHTPETHLIPLILQVAMGQRDSVSIFGGDYSTADGTCVRDYVHVMDLAQAHWLALRQLHETHESAIYNLGNGSGFSVKQVIECARQVTGHPIEERYAPRRSGDPAILVASSDKARRQLGWNPQYAQLDQILTTAWNWHRHHPQGYRTPTASRRV